MQMLTLNDLKRSGPAPALFAGLLLALCSGMLWAAEEANVVSPEDAIWNPDLSEADPGPMGTSEVYRVMQAEPRCSFHYTEASPPVLVVGETAAEGALHGLIKLHDRLVLLTPAGAKRFDQLRVGGVFEAKGMEVRILETGEAVQLEDGQNEAPATMRFILNQGADTGYSGFYRCT